MLKLYRIELSDFDLGQVIDGLSTRAEAWEKTAEYHRTGESPDNFIIEECRDAAEAEKIAAHYHSLILKLQEQRKAQL